MRYSETPKTITEPYQTTIAMKKETEKTTNRLGKNKTVRPLESGLNFPLNANHEAWEEHWLHIFGRTPKGLLHIY